MYFIFEIILSFTPFEFDENISTELIESEFNNKNYYNALVVSFLFRWHLS